MSCTDGPAFWPHSSVTQNPVPQNYSTLKLHVEDLPEEGPQLAGDAQFLLLSEAFARATGWQLQFQPGCVDDGGERWSAPIIGKGAEVTGRLSLLPSAPADDAKRTKVANKIELESVRPLALSLANLLSEVQQTRHALWQREAELAAGVPVALRPDERLHLAERLQAVLQGGAEEEDLLSRRYS